MIKTAEEIREQFELETGKNWVTIPVSHGELGFASWEYQLWLENKVAQFIQPQKVDSGNVWRWVKCSERLPENENNVLINHNERYQRAYYRDKWFVAGTNVVAAYEHQNPQIEWLERLPQGEWYSVEDWTETSTMPEFDGAYQCHIIRNNECGTISNYQEVVQCFCNTWVVKDRETVTHWKHLTPNPLT